MILITGLNLALVFTLYVKTGKIIMGTFGGLPKKNRIIVRYVKLYISPDIYSPYPTTKRIQTAELGRWFATIGLTN